MGLSGEEGRKSIGRYEVVKTIGKGAMGRVFRAQDEVLDRFVALKIVPSKTRDGSRSRQLDRFLAFNGLNAGSRLVPGQKVKLIVYGTRRRA